MTNSIFKEPTKALPVSIDMDGNLRAQAMLTLRSDTTRCRVAVPSQKTIPVIVIAGIMGSNLRAKFSGENKELKSGEAAWRPPNGAKAGLSQANMWKNRSPAIRQRILDSNTLEVDPGGEISGIPEQLSEETCRNRGWGEIHSDSYGDVLSILQKNLNCTLRFTWGDVEIEDAWEDINDFERGDWGAECNGITSAITKEELLKFSTYQFPVYGFGYNWLQSNRISAVRLQERIDSIIASWVKAKHQCTMVILVTHSMGGLVARASAKRHPEKIAAIVHGVMPALGAVACYRRLACGTEASRAANGKIENAKMKKFAEIAGQTSEETTPVLALSPGPLELLPNHKYPPWLSAEIRLPHDPYAVRLDFPQNNPYSFYKDFECWYRAINISIADPANLYGDGIKEKISLAVNQAEKFHRISVGDYYHPNSAAFYGFDENELSFGEFRWIAPSLKAVSPAYLQSGTELSHTFAGGRNVKLTKGGEVYFSPSEQDALGDGTVPVQSGAGPAGHINHLFRTSGYSHQGAYKNDAMLALTQHLIVKLAQKIL